MDCKREFTIIQIERLLLPVKWKTNGLYIIIIDIWRDTCTHQNKLGPIFYSF